MLRTILEGAVLFCLPFGVFTLVLYLRGQNPLDPASWSKKALGWLTGSALVLCIAALAYWGAAHTTSRGSYVPSHVDKDGRFVPGQFRP